MDKQIITFEVGEAIEEHARLVMEWRNDPVTLQMSFHHEPKEWESFFFEYRRDYFPFPQLPPLFALLEGKRIAFIRFTPIEQEDKWDFNSQNCCEIGINIAPEHRGRRLSSNILRALEPFVKKQGFEAIYAEVRKENIPSHKAFTKAGYEKLGDKIKEVKETKEKCSIGFYLKQLICSSFFKEGIFIIAEAGSNWRMGTAARDRQMAKALIDVAKESGADAVKFQTFCADSVYVKNAGSSDYLSEAGIQENISDIFEDLAMPYEMVGELAAYCKELGILFLSSPFSAQDFHVVDSHVQLHKLASYEMSHLRLLELMARSKKPLIMSTGAATEEDIDWAVDTFRREGGKELLLMQCTAKYPAPSHTLNLSLIPFLKKRYGCLVGLSDHSRDPLQAPLAAVALGAKAIEKHFTLDNRLPGPDHTFAVTANELKAMVEGIREVEKMRGHPIKRVEREEEELYTFACRGIQATDFIKAGELFCEGENIAILRPGKRKKGIHPKNLERIEGKKALYNISSGEGIQEEDFLQ